LTEPDSPRRGHKFDVAALFEIVPILHPFGFRTAGGCLHLRSDTGRPVPLAAGLDARPAHGGRPLWLPASLAAGGVGLDCAPVGRWPHPTAGAPTWLLPRPLRQAGAKYGSPALRGLINNPLTAGAIFYENLTVILAEIKPLSLGLPMGFKTDTRYKDDFDLHSPIAGIPAKNGHNHGKKGRVLAKSICFGSQLQEFWLKIFWRRKSRRPH